MRLREILIALTELHPLISYLHHKVHEMSAQLDALTAQVSANNSLVDSALTLIQGLRDQIVAAGTDPAALQALVDSLTAKDAQLAAAVANQTPVA